MVSEVSPGAEERRSRVQEQVAAPGLRSLSLQFAAENGQLLEPTQVEHRFESPHAGVRDHLREAASARELEHAIVALERGPRPVNQVLQQPHVPVGDSGVSAGAPGGTEQSRLPNVLHAVHVPEVEPRQPAVPESRRRPLHAELLRDGERTFRAHEPTLRITADRPAPALRLERVEELRTARAVLDQCHRLVDHLAEVAAEMHVHPRERNHRACRRPEIPLFPEPRHRPLEQIDRDFRLPLLQRDLARQREELRVARAFFPGEKERPLEVDGRRACVERDVPLGGEGRITERGGTERLRGSLAGRPVVECRAGVVSEDVDVVRHAVARCLLDPPGDGLVLVRAVSPGELGIGAVTNEGVRESELGLAP